MRIWLFAVIAAGVIYHLAQRASSAASPWPMLAVGYGVAFAMTLVLAIGSGGALPTRGEATGGALIGLSAFAIEAGFFFIYRAGWPLASASVIAGVSTTALLALIGILVFGDELSATRATGLVLAAGAATLISRG